MTTTPSTPATMISSTREPGPLADALDRLPRIDYGAGLVLAGAVVIGALALAYRISRPILRDTAAETEALRQAAEHSRRATAERSRVSSAEEAAALVARVQAEAAARPFRPITDNRG